MRTTILIAGVTCGLFLGAQTRIDPSQQALPTVVQFATCSGSGTGTIPHTVGNAEL
jgi:hypothetical protein